MSLAVGTLVASLANSRQAASFRRVAAVATVTMSKAAWIVRSGKTAVLPERRLARSSACPEPVTPFCGLWRIDGG